jgi:hypothetical protein
MPTLSILLRDSGRSVVPELRRTESGFRAEEIGRWTMNTCRSSRTDERNERFTLNVLLVCFSGICFCVTVSVIVSLVSSAN